MGIQKRNAEEFRFRRFELRGATSLASILEGGHTGIYILEFANGERYVGQSVDVRSRFTQHVHGSGHKPWTDVTAFAFLDVPAADLNRVERLIIETQRGEGRTLRNRQFNIDYSGPSPFDAIVSLEEQKHWACGDFAFDISQFRRGAGRPLKGHPKLMNHPFAQKEHPFWCLPDGSPFPIAASVIGDLGSTLSAVPCAVELEKKYWTISDCPSTAGGRLATLNVGCLEIYVCGRHIEQLVLDDGEVLQVPMAFLNLAPGSFLKYAGGKMSIKEQWQPLFDELPLFYYSHSYSVTTTDALFFPSGLVQEILKEPLVREALQTLCLKLMRRGEASLFRRWHSEDLATLAYQQVVTQYSGDPAAEILSSS